MSGLPFKAGSITDDLFNIVDQDHDGVISRQEFRTAVKTNVINVTHGSGSAAAPAVQRVGGVSVAANAASEPMSTLTPAATVGAIPTFTMALTSPGAIGFDLNRGSRGSVYVGGEGVPDMLSQTRFLPSFGQGVDANENGTSNRYVAGRDGSKDASNGPCRYRSYSPPRRLEGTGMLLPGMMRGNAVTRYPALAGNKIVVPSTLFGASAPQSMMPLFSLKPTSIPPSPLMRPMGHPMPIMLPSAGPPMPCQGVPAPITVPSPVSTAPMTYSSPPVTTMGITQGQSTAIINYQPAGGPSLGSTISSTVASSRMSVAPYNPHAAAQVVQVPPASHVAATMGSVAEAREPAEISELSATIAQREAQIQELEFKLQRSAALLAERDERIAELARKNEELQKALPSEQPASNGMAMEPARGPYSRPPQRLVPSNAVEPDGIVQQDANSRANPQDQPSLRPLRPLGQRAQSPVVRPMSPMEAAVERQMQSPNAAALATYARPPGADMQAPMSSDRPTASIATISGRSEPSPTLPACQGAPSVSPGGLGSPLGAPSPQGSFAIPCVGGAPRGSGSPQGSFAAPAVMGSPAGAGSPHGSYSIPDMPTSTGLERPQPQGTPQVTAMVSPFGSNVQGLQASDPSSAMTDPLAQMGMPAAGPVGGSVGMEPPETEWVGGSNGMDVASAEEEPAPPTVSQPIPPPAQERPRAEAQERPRQTAAGRGSSTARGRGANTTAATRGRARGRGASPAAGRGASAPVRGAGSAAERTAAVSRPPPATRQGFGPGPIDSMQDPPSAPQSVDGGDMDEIDQRIQQYFQQHPEFTLEMSKVKKGWYMCGPPISKKVFVKTTGNDKVLVRAGTGYEALDKFFDKYRPT
mmetsp:Transcript_43656/g.120815  ORF Transcript_43656/g.120815 Transcript_43656/m.120815 type:complete len:867 (+) Transcript_43656:181-2781(+)